MSTYIYPLEESQNQIAGFLHHFLTTYDLMKLLPPMAINVDEETRCRIIARKYIELVLNDELSTRMHWASKTNESVTYITSMFPWWNDSCEDELSDIFYCDILGEVDSIALMFYQHMIPSKTWNVWSIEFKGSNAFFTKGEDYRIMDYERKVKSGELTVESHISKLIKRG